MQPIIYSSLDAGAPQLSLTAGALNTVLKGCLVTGYGDKPAAGWEVAHEDMATHKLAIRSISPKSIKSVLLLSDSATRKADVTAYTNWDTAKNTGINSFGSGAFLKAWDGVYNAVWVIVATDRFFYLFVQSSSQYTIYNRVVTFFGDVDTTRANHDYAVLCASASNASYSEQSTGLRTVAVSSGKTAIFPRSPHYTHTEYFGERSTSSIVHGATKFKTDIVMFSKFALYMEQDGWWEPLLILPGMLLTYGEIRSFESSGALEFLSNQSGFVNKLICNYQPWHGRIWLHTDDWG